MKVLILLATLMLSFPASAAEPDVKVKVDGMVCDFCAQSLIKLFSKEAGVEEAAVDLDAGLVNIELKDGQNITDAQINKLVDYSGYKVTGIERGGKTKK